MTAKEIITNRYDRIDVKELDEFDIVTALLEIPESERNLSDNYAEWLAFALVEGDDNTWNTYFGPLFVDKDGIHHPTYESITPDIISYWETRIIETVNPFLKTRYSGLVFNFKNKITTEKLNTNIIQNYISSLIETVKGNYPKYSKNRMTKLSQAFHVALKIKQKTFICQIKEVSVQIDKDTPDCNIGTWGWLFSLMMKHMKEYSLEEKNLIVTNVEERVYRLINMSLDAEGNERYDVFAIEEAIKLLSQYYWSEGEKDKLENSLKTLNNAYRKSFPAFTTIQKCNFLNNLRVLYSQYQFNNEAIDLLAEIQEMGKGIEKEMSKTEVSSEISKEQMYSFLNEMTNGNFKDVLLRFILQFIPNKKHLDDQLLTSSKKNPFMSMFSIHKFDYKGRPMSIIGGIENDIDGQLVLYISEVIKIQHIFIDATINESIQKGFFSTDSILQYLRKSPLFEEDRFVIIECGLKAFFEKNTLNVFTC